MQLMMGMTMYMTVFCAFRKKFQHNLKQNSQQKNGLFQPPTGGVSDGDAHRQLAVRVRERGHGHGHASQQLAARGTERDAPPVIAGGIAIGRAGQPAGRHRRLLHRRRGDGHRPGLGDVRHPGQGHQVEALQLR